MKKTFILLSVLISALLLTAAAGAVTPLDPERDAFITCGTNLADYSGKTFENLYVLLNSCKEFQSPILPEDNAFVTLSDINVTGTLYFVDDQYDPEKDSYRESLSWDSLTRANHYLNIAGESYVENLYVECMNPHSCSVGIQYPSVVNNLIIVPTSAASRGKIVVRGFIDPLVDTKTNYYTDAIVASYPEFNFNTFDREFADPIDARFKVFEREAETIAYDGMVYGIKAHSTEKYSQIFADKYPYPEEIAATNAYLKRGKVNNLSVYNKYMIGSGDMNIDLINLFVETAMITNGKSIDSTTVTDFVRVWTPVIRAGGFTNIGIMSVFSPLKTAALSVDGYTFPLYIDVMVVGTEGVTEKITLASTKIAMLNYLGGLSPYSVLKLEFTAPDKGYIRHIPCVGMLVIHGGRVNLEAASYYREIYYIGTFWIFCGRDDFRFEAGDNGIASAEAYLKLPAANHIAARDNEDADFHYDESENKDREELFQKYNKYFSYNGSDITDVVSGNIYDWTWTLCTTAIGANWIANIFDEYLAPAPEDVKLAYTSKIWLYSVSFGEFNIESKLDEVVKTGWFSAFCSVHQFGESSSTRMSMNIVD